MALAFVQRYLNLLYEILFIIPCFLSVSKKNRIRVIKTNLFIIINIYYT